MRPGLRKLLVGVVLVLSVSPVMAVDSHRGIFDCAGLLNTSGQSARAFHTYFNEIRRLLPERHSAIRAAEIALLAKQDLLILGPSESSARTFSQLILGGISSSEFGTYEAHYITGHTDPNVLSTSTFSYVGNLEPARPSVLTHLRESLFADRLKKDNSLWSQFASIQTSLEDLHQRLLLDPTLGYLFQEYALVAYLPSRVHRPESFRDLIHLGRVDRLQLPKFSLHQLKDLHSLLSQVVIPPYIADMLAHLHYRVPAIIAELTGRPTSEGTVIQSGEILRALVVHSWVESEGARPLIASSSDLRRMTEFFGLNAPSQSVVTDIMAAEKVPESHSELKKLLDFLQSTDRVFGPLIKEFASLVSSLQMDQIALDFYNKKQDIVDSLRMAYEQLHDQADSVVRSFTMVPREVATIVVYDGIRGWLHDLKAGPPETPVSNPLKEHRMGAIFAQEWAPQTMPDPLPELEGLADMIADFKDLLSAEPTFGSLELKLQSAQPPLVFNFERPSLQVDHEVFVDGYKTPLSDVLLFLPNVEGFAYGFSPQSVMVFDPKRPMPVFSKMTTERILSGNRAFALSSPNGQLADIVSLEGSKLRKVTFNPIQDRILSEISNFVSFDSNSYLKSAEDLSEWMETNWSTRVFPGLEPHVQLWVNQLQKDILAVNTDNAAIKVLFHEPDRNSYFISLSPDGASAYFVRSEKGSAASLLQVNLQNGSVHRRQLHGLHWNVAGRIRGGQFLDDDVIMLGTEKLGVSLVRPANGELLSSQLTPQSAVWPQFLQEGRFRFWQFDDDNPQRAHMVIYEPGL